MEGKDRRFWVMVGGPFDPLVPDPDYRLADLWEEINHTGEGYFPALVADEFDIIIGVDGTAPEWFFQWVRITDGTKVLATFFLKEQGGELVEMSLAVARKGQAPNPFDPLTDSDLSWSVEKYSPFSMPQSMDEVQAQVDKFAAYRRSEEYESFDDEGDTPEKISQDIEGFRMWMMKDFDARRDSRPPGAVNRGNTTIYGRGQDIADRGDNVRLTTAVVAVPAKDRDTRFKFRVGRDSFTMRGSILAPRLLEARRAGLQRVDIKFLQRR